MTGDIGECAHTVYNAIESIEYARKLLREVEKSSRIIVLSSSEGKYVTEAIKHLDSAIKQLES